MSSTEGATFNSQGQAKRRPWNVTHRGRSPERAQCTIEIEGSTSIPPFQGQVHIDVPYQRRRFACPWLLNVAPSALSSVSAKSVTSNTPYDSTLPLIRFRRDAILVKLDLR